MSKTFRVLALSVLATMLAATVSHFAEAKGKPGGDGGGGDTGGGTIYFSSNPGGFSTMDSNGGSRTSLGIHSGEPSFELHSGQRWYVNVRELATGETYPNGLPRSELFAFNEGGAVVQLTNQPDLEVWWQGYRWTPGDNTSAGDQHVSWTARRWETTTDPMTGQTVFTGNVVDGGIYRAEISFALGEPVLLEQPPVPVVAVELVSSQGFWEAYEDGPTFAPNVHFHSWSPGGAFLVYDLLDERNKGLWIAAPNSNDEHLPVSSTGRNPEWSPDGALIAYDGWDGIETINFDGTNPKAIISSTATVSFYGPHWSPTGSHLTYSAFDHWSKPSDPLPGRTYVYRATATGGGKTNLTKDLNSASPRAWR